MKTGSLTTLICVSLAGLLLVAGALNAQGKSDVAPGQLLADMMSDEQMTALQALAKVRDGELNKDKAKYETAKNNLIALIKNPKKDYTIRALAAEVTAYHQVKTALPTLKATVKTETNPMLKYAFQNSIDRLEGKVSGEVYSERPAYSGTPQYYGTPGYAGTPGYHGTPGYYGTPGYMGTPRS